MAEKASGFCRILPSHWSIQRTRFPLRKEAKFPKNLSSRESLKAKFGIQYQFNRQKGPRNAEFSVAD
jgi:hypothetical protein